MSAVRIAVLGAGGKMGRANVRAMVGLAETEGRLTVAVAHGASRALGQDAGTVAGAGPAGVVIRAELPAAGEPDVWVDFSAPAAAGPNAEAAAAAGANLVVGTTGLPPGDRERIAGAARKVGVVFSPNMSVGVSVLLISQLVRQISPGGLDGEHWLKVERAEQIASFCHNDRCQSVNRNIPILTRVVMTPPLLACSAHCVAVLSCAGCAHRIDRCHRLVLPGHYLLGDVRDAPAARHRARAQPPVGVGLTHAAFLDQDGLGSVDDFPLAQPFLGIAQLSAGDLVVAEHGGGGAQDRFHVRRGNPQDVVRVTLRPGSPPP